MTKTAKGTNGHLPKQKDVGYVACRAEPGMFRDELLVFIDGVDPVRPNEALKVQVLVDADLVRSMSGNPVRGKPISAFLRAGLRTSRRATHADCQRPHSDDRIRRLSTMGIHPPNRTRRRKSLCGKIKAI